MTATSTIAIGVGIVGLGLIGGLFWGWAVSALPGLARVTDRTYVTSMQSINRAILNPIFLVTFVGTLVVLVVATAATFWAGHTRRAWWILAATAAYGLGVFGVTVAGNVPLNDKLEAFDMAGATDAAIAAARHGYEGPWNRLHFIRSAVGVLAIALAAAAALTPAAD